MTSSIKRRPTEIFRIGNVDLFQRTKYLINDCARYWIFYRLLCTLLDILQIIVHVIGYSTDYCARY